MSEAEYSSAAARPRRDGRSLRELFGAELALHGITWCRGAGMDSDQLRRVMRDVGDAVNAYQQGQGFGGIEKLPSEIEHLRGVAYVRHAQEIRHALKRKDHGAILSELILVLERLERERG